MDQVQAVAGVCLVVIASVTAIFIGLQARDLAKQAHIANHVSAVQAMRDLSSSLQRVNLLFVERPEMRPFFYEGKKLPRGGNEKHWISALSEVVADYLETSLYSEEHLPDFARDNREDLRRWIRFLEQNSPALLEVVHNSPDWWPRLRDELKGSPA